MEVVLRTASIRKLTANTTTAIKNYMTSVWSAATSENPAPTYLLIVGDTSTSGNNVIAMPAQVSSPSSDHVTDNYYVRLSGTDYVPEMYYGRFSVSSATELTTIDGGSGGAPTMTKNEAAPISPRLTSRATVSAEIFSRVSGALSWA